MKTERAMANNPNSLANLIPWKPGQSGNPSGRRKSLITREDVEHLVQTYAVTAFEKLDEIINDKSRTPIEIIVAQTWKELADPKRKGERIGSLAQLIDLAVGKVVTNANASEVQRNEALDGIPKPLMIQLVKEGKNKYK
jgi:hypothetical protein